MLYRIEIYPGHSTKPLKVGNWSWTNKGEAINYAKHWFNNWVTGDRDKRVIVRQQQRRKIVFTRLPEKGRK